MAQRDVSKLPIWGQELVRSLEAEVRRLNGELAELRDKAADGPEGSDTFADPYARPKPLGKGALVCFSPGGDPTDGFMAELKDDSLTVSVQTTLRTKIVVFPDSGNQVSLRIVPLRF
jgi:hypothetical protein